MNYEERRQRGIALGASLWEEIEREAGLGLRLPNCWEMVGPESARFMELLLLWEQTGDEDLIDRVRQAYDEVVNAWRDAARLYETRRQVS